MLLLILLLLMLVLLLLMLLLLLLVFLVLLLLSGIVGTTVLVLELFSCGIGIYSLLVRYSYFSLSNHLIDYHESILPV